MIRRFRRVQNEADVAKICFRDVLQFRRGTRGEMRTWGGRIKLLIQVFDACVFAAGPVSRRSWTGCAGNGKQVG